ncbi:MAG TPA: class I SAM-dependent methyltransferase [Leptospiraceae bacterium]|nr:class I SAM-dependent methyltransferase [Leptospiraceae bacterium]HMW03852.1 class I SAM-dependent methyltransferase [Leptospiraceae bacterium]HMX32901.1 class I SAM-dependent methyltransferase [Leptospiraceae bacterium]HMY29832.1 class I SAM-dependent methyltransferase [Leptospiraceae bacterium]HMZ65186.1 class I SAM-dependent methyltransferase [Leptospiraceae bacterium]
MSFNQKYWDEMYAEEEGSVIDGIHNAKEHALYAKSILDLGEVKVKSMADLGFGKAILLKEFTKQFRPERIIAIDPSEEAVSILKKQKWIQSTRHKIYKSTLEKFNPKTKVDLGICNSVFQYISTPNIRKTYEKLAGFCKYLYFSVPTKEDYLYMEKELNFVDPYALVRTKKFYLDSLSPYFTIVSHNLLESKILINESGFLYEFFRF